MSNLRAPLAPVLPGEADLSVVEHEVLDILRRRSLQYSSGMLGVTSPAVTRSELCQQVRTSDRTIRDAVEGLRTKGWPVLSSSAVAGYWLSDDPAEVDEFIEREFVSRKRHHARSSRGLRRASTYMRARQQDGAAYPVQGRLDV